MEAFISQGASLILIISQAGVFEFIVISCNRYQLLSINIVQTMRIMWNSSGPRVVLALRLVLCRRPKCAHWTWRTNPPVSAGPPISHEDAAICSCAHDGDAVDNRHQTVHFPRLRALQVLSLRGGAHQKAKNERPVEMRDLWERKYRDTA